LWGRAAMPITVVCGSDLEQSQKFLDRNICVSQDVAESTLGNLASVPRDGDN